MKIELIKQLMTEFENSQVFKMKVEIDEIKLELEKEPKQSVQFVQEMPQQIVQPQVQPVEEKVEVKEEVKGTEVTSPLVGVFYPASSPTSKPYVQLGDHVTKGQTLCIVEAMKVMNEIKSPVDGTVLAINAKNEDTVEYGTVLMVIG